ncbi:hypothetical protein BC349_10050 [Flavihumibacter stibioxidans]|uniref:Uncharacterized protein n=1 Tax=Flavihumibacter stibioxidans TaxID=1834163 RepID=A0ABR7M8L1_9BACT|nr:hypothetical protein [Flavihumibacter stibioxidans]
MGIGIMDSIYNDFLINNLIDDYIREAFQSDIPKHLKTARPSQAVVPGNKYKLRSHHRALPA